MTKKVVAPAPKAKIRGPIDKDAPSGTRAQPAVRKGPAAYRAK